MADIKYNILAHAKTRKPQYADRMEIFQPTLGELPAGLIHYVINIKGLHGYIPISYLVLGNDFYSSLEPGDFSRLAKRLRLFEIDNLTALELAIIYLLVDFPSRERRIIENVADLELVDDNQRELAYQLAKVITPPSLQRANNQLECSFICFNSRSNWLERFNLTIYPSYHYDCENVALAEVAVDENS
jgi:hypothetical protein